METRIGTLALKIPKLRSGSYFPSFLDPRKSSEQALVAVVQEAYVKGISTRKVDDLVQAMGMSGISKSQVTAFGVQGAQGIAEGLVADAQCGAQGAMRGGRSWRRRARMRSANGGGGAGAKRCSTVSCRASVRVRDR